MTNSPRIREIPYNYTSFSDREIIIRFLGESAWDVVNTLRSKRRTGRSARMLFEILGDMWVISRNPFIQDDLLQNKKRWQSLLGALHHRLDQIIQRAEDNSLVLELMDTARQAINKFAAGMDAQAERRKQVLKKLSKVTKAHNVAFDGLARVSHVTDATDWRVEYPFVVISPDSEMEMQQVVQSCIDLGLTIIPRGGGTGYTGGVIPLHADTAVINVEKLDQVGDVVFQEWPGIKGHIATVHAECGVVTRRVSEKAEAQGYIFAVDPTSQDASTIGGNVAMNAGGKKAVCWGTTIDNLLAWKMVMPDGNWLEVTRLNPNQGKIHDLATAEFLVKRNNQEETLSIPASAFRLRGLGKDVTNKFLNGLPGIQKEGCDGLITSATFILHKQAQHMCTVCLEFFGADLRRAVPAIVEVKSYLDELDGVLLTGLEHLDQRYVKAVKYTTKSARRAHPKMVLLADIAGDDLSVVEAAAAQVVTLAQAREGEGFIASTPESRQRFWSDRARTAAIAAHTNAFKINEDVVIPLDRLADYNDGIERINIEQSMANKIAIVSAVQDYLDGKMPELSQDQDEDAQVDDAVISSKCHAAQQRLNEVKNHWQSLLDHLDEVVTAADFPEFALETEDSFFSLLQQGALRISYRQKVAQPLQEIFAGQAFSGVRAQLDAIHKALRNSRLFVATHMHAGDGNVHTNIPVNSNDYMMMQAADRIVERVMQLARDLGGVISGEHGIGLTKMQFLPKQAIEDFAQYKQTIDPQGHFNRGKLLLGSGLENAYTPSLRLLEQEALILEASDLGELNHAIKDCLRCGKCKPVCTTHVPRANLLYSPRNKILATGLVIEAFLYEEQTRRGISIHHFEALHDIADHCTVCHRCLNPCPVNIDFGEVSVSMRTILGKQKKKHFRPVTAISMQFLNVTDPRMVKAMRKVLVEWGYWGQRLGYRLAKRLPRLGINKDKLPAPTTGHTALTQQVVHFVKRPLPQQQIMSQTMRALLHIEDDKVIPILRDPNKVNDESDAIFYFPGCGSERLFSQIGLATLAMLYDVGAQTILPPSYLCCGYPQSAGGDADKGKAISTENQVLFHRIANTLNYMDIKTVLVSCGTCMDQLLSYRFQQIFPGCRLLDIHEYLMEKNVRLTESSGVKYLYHEPCHTPMKQYKSLQVASQLMNQEVVLSDRCCGEAGTFAVSRPDIATQVRFRKEQEIKQGVQQLTGKDHVTDGEVKLLTSCPACQQGLGRYSDVTGVETNYIVEELAKLTLGPDWQQTFIKQVAAEGIERVLL